jgi:hypothetical protein
MLERTERVLDLATTYTAAVVSVGLCGYFYWKGVEVPDELKIAAGGAWGWIYRRTTEAGRLGP